MPDELAQLAAAIWRRWRRKEYAGALPLAADYCLRARALPGAAGRVQLAYGLNIYGALCFQLGELDEADRLLREALDIFHETGRLLHPQGIDTLRNLARVTDALGHPDDALTMHREAHALLTVLYGEDDPQTQACLRDLREAEARRDAARPAPGPVPEPAADPDLPADVPAFVFEEEPEEESFDDFAGLLEVPAEEPVVIAEMPADVEAPVLPNPPAPAPLPTVTPSLFSRRGAQHQEGAFGFLFLTATALVWRPAMEGTPVILPYRRIAALGCPPEGGAFYLRLEGEGTAHTFGVDMPDRWVQEIYRTLRGESRDPLAEKVAREFGLCDDAVMA